MHEGDEAADEDHIGREQQHHHFQHVLRVRPDLPGRVKRLGHGDGIGERRGLEQVDQVVVERRQAYAQCERQDDVAERTEPRIAQRLRRLDGGRGHRLDAGAEDLDVEGAGEQRQRDDRPTDVADQWLARSIGRLHRRQHGADAEIEEKDLHQRRRVAEHRDEAGHHPAHKGRMRALRRGADRAND